MTKKQLITIIEFIKATVNEVTFKPQHQQDFNIAKDKVWETEKNLYKSFGFDIFEEDSDA